MTTARSIPSSMDPAIVAAIDRRLADVAAFNQVTIPLAIESGSRAWGFPSPDSDYDCRFVFVRRPERYLTPWPRRDVIETPLDKVFDVNGWDLAKALKLLLNGNAVIIEWLTSPIAYGVDERFRSDFLALADRVADRRLIGRHYFHLGRLQHAKHFHDGATVALKKLSYVIRPAAALRWLRRRPEAAVAPMHFPTLMRECDPPPDLAAIIEDLMARKAVTRELGEGPLPIEVRRFVESEFAAGENEFASRARTADDSARRAAAEAFFRDVVARSAGAAAPSDSPSASAEVSFSFVVIR